MTTTTMTQRYGKSPRHNRGQKNTDTTRIVVGLMALVALLPYTATAFSASSPRVLVTRTKPTETHVGVGRSIHRPVLSALQYREGNEDQQTTTQTMSSSTSSKSLTMSKKWFMSFLHLQPRSESASDSDKVDEYLQFLDKRYHRLHDDDDKASSSVPTDSPLSSSSAKFSALKWLHHKDQLSSTPLSSQQEENALYVLGVAGLASEKLLQKHAGHKKLSKASKSINSSVSTTTKAAAAAQGPQESAIDVVVDHTNQSSITQATPVASFFRWLAVQQCMLHRKQSLRLRSVTSFLARSSGLGRPPLAAKKLWALGGGQKNVAWTVTVMVAFCFLLFQPVLAGGTA